MDDQLIGFAGVMCINVDGTPIT